jgi:hypothetical protein
VGVVSRRCQHLVRGLGWRPVSPQWPLCRFDFVAVVLGFVVVGRFRRGFVCGLGWRLVSLRLPVCRLAFAMVVPGRAVACLEVVVQVVLCSWVA